MRRIIRNIINIISLITVFVFVSCSNGISKLDDNYDSAVVEKQNGNTTVKMFVPDYYALAEQNASRVIAPQTKKVRLSYQVNEIWVGINTINLSEATKTPLENAPNDFPGSVYSCVFTGVPVGTYEQGNLLIELLDENNNVITSGTSTTNVEIVRGNSDSTVFYTLPCMTGEKVGFLSAGEMKFSVETLYSDIQYKVSMKTSGDYPDIALFSNDGKLINYFAIDDADDKIQFEVPITGQYYIGVWADDGNKIGRYEYSFGKMEFYTKDLYKGIHYDIDISSNGAYPDVVLYKEGKLVRYYTINGEQDSHITLTPEESGQYTFVIYGNEKDDYSFEIDDVKIIYVNLLENIDYSVIVNSSNEYPKLALLNYSEYGAFGQLLECEIIEYWDIQNELDCKKNVSVNKKGKYAFALIGKNPDSYNLQFDFTSGTELKGVLTGDSLHLRKENSPYIVTGNLLVDESSELNIDPGVIIQFTGAYYLKINGSVSAIGTASAPIIMVPSGDNFGTWNGISINGGNNISVCDNYEYSAGNILSNCIIIGASSPLSMNGAVYVESCTFSDCYGNISGGTNSILIHNTINCDVRCASGTVIDNVIHGSVGSDEWYNVYTSYINNDIYGTVTAGWNSKFKNNTIKNGSLYFYNFEGLFVANTIYDCPINYYELRTSAKIVSNNFLEYEGIVFDSSQTSYSTNLAFDFTGNYWGEAQTVELNEKGEKANISFINDYYDNFEWMKVNYSNWATEPIEGVGYLGDGFIAFDYTINGYNYDNGGYYPESISPELTISVLPQYHANEIASIRIAQSITELKEKDWLAYNANQNFTVDKNSLTGGIATIYVQLKDSEGNISSSLMHEVPFDNPVVNLSIEDGAIYTSATSSITLEYGATDEGNIQQYELMLDDEVISSYEESYGWGKNYSSSCTLGLAYMPAGEHVIKATFWDSARNSTTKTVTFTIKRTVNAESFETSFDSESGQLLKDSNTLYLWHFNGDGSEVSGNENLSISGFTAGIDGINGCASYVYTSDLITIPLDEAFTIECWRKENSFSLYKSSVFNFYLNYVYSYYKSASGSVNNNYLDWKNVSDTNWHYYSYVYNGKYMAVYRDGVLLNYIDGLNQTMNTNDNKLYLYAQYIDELRISKIARSPDEIAAYYNAAKDKIQ